MNATRARSGPRTLLAIAAALGLVAALAMPALADGHTDWATVTGYADGTSDNNHAETWGDTCEKLSEPGGGWGDTYELPALADGYVYSLVIVKAGSDQSTEAGANTLFANPSAGQTVWADSDGDGEYSDGDKQISHIIVCTEEAEETPTPTEDESPAEETASPTPTPTPTEDESPAEETASPDETPDGVLGGNPTPTPGGGTLPDTAIGGMSQVPATVLSLILLAALAATAYARLARQR